MMGDGVLKHHRAVSGASAAKITNRRYPLRRVVGHTRNEYGATLEVLECGHHQRARSDMISEYDAVRRRCEQCPPRDRCTCGHWHNRHAESWPHGVSIPQPGGGPMLRKTAGCVETGCVCAAYACDLSERVISSG